MVGDIVIAPVPYTDLSGSKERLVVLVADVRMGDWIVCAITGTRQRRPGDMAITRQDVQGTGLRRDSWVRTGRLYTLNDSLFGRVIGGLTDAKLVEILRAVRSLF